MQASRAEVISELTTGQLQGEKDLAYGIDNQGRVLIQKGLFQYVYLVPLS